MKKTILFLSVLLSCSQAAFAYDFSAVAPSGQTLYYNINYSGSVTVTYPMGSTSNNPWGSYTKPVGDLIIPDTVTYGGITYPVTIIAQNAFSGCTGLTSVTIPNSITNIAQNAFSGCTGLTSVTIPNSITSIGNYAFYHCTGLTSVTIPDSVTSIGDGAFYHCTGLTSVTIPNSITNIGNYAFYQCTGLTSVTIPNSVTSIGNYAFYQCTGLTSVAFNADSCTYAGISTSTSSSSFFWCTNITSFTFGNNVKVIPAYLCNNLTGLTSVTIPNSVTSIGDGAFYHCTGLTSVTIPNSVTSIEYAAFRQCTGLTSVTIGNSVTSIGYDAFYQCTGLTSVTIPDSVTSIGDGAFYKCSGLTSVTIGNSVTSIGYDAFYQCTGLTSVTIPNSVTSIGDRAFSSCSGLSSITFLRPTPPTMPTGGYSSPFSCIASNYVVYIPCGSLSLYATIISASHLQQMNNDFSAVSADDSTGVVNILTFPSCTNPNAVLSAVPADGYQFDHWSTGSTNNPYTLTVTSDTIITAFFVEAYNVTILVDDPATGGVIGGGVYGNGSSVTITAYPANGYRFDHWSTGSTDNPYTLTVTSDTTITAFFEDANIVTVLVDNPAMGSVTGGGAYENGSSVTITAYPADGYLFDHWSTGNTDNPYTLTVTTDTTITAYFVPNGGTEGIGEIDEDDIRIDVLDGCIFVEGITNEELRVYDITGRMVQNRSLPSGVYIVKIGTLPAQKVVVMR